MYSIVYILDPHDYFLLDGSTGELHVAKPLDREALIDTNGVISLTVRVSLFRLLTSINIRRAALLKKK